jgi:hypothetical protein
MNEVANLSDALLKTRDKIVYSELLWHDFMFLIDEWKSDMNLVNNPPFSPIWILTTNIVLSLETVEKECFDQIRLCEDSRKSISKLLHRSSEEVAHIDFDWEKLEQWWSAIGFELGVRISDEISCTPFLSQGKSDNSYRDTFDSRGSGELLEKSNKRLNLLDYMIDIIPFNTRVKNLLTYLLRQQIRFVQIVSNQKKMSRVIDLVNSAHSVVGRKEITLQRQIQELQDYEIINMEG